MEPQALWTNFRDAVANHYFDMTGRVGRAQFWYFVLVYIVLAIMAGILQTATWLPLAAIFNLAMLLPTTGMGARRLQDIGRDGRLIWMFGAGMSALFVLGLLFDLLWLIDFLLLLPLIALVSFLAQPGDPGPNVYGPPPPVFDPSAKPIT